LYPKISLAGLLGYRDVTDLSGFRIWSLAGAVTMPIFNAGRIRSQIAAAEARQQQALLFALEEVDLGLISYPNAEATRQALSTLGEREGEACTCRRALPARADRVHRRSRSAAIAAGVPDLAHPRAGGGWPYLRRPY
jgi:hypothetical protein